MQLRKGMGGWGKENIKRDAPIRYRIILSGVRSVIYILKYQELIIIHSMRFDIIFLCILTGTGSAQSYRKLSREEEREEGGRKSK